MAKKGIFANRMLNAEQRYQLKRLKLQNKGRESAIKTGLREGGKLASRITTNLAATQVAQSKMDRDVALANAKINNSNNENSLKAYSQAILNAFGQDGKKGNETTTDPDIQGKPNKGSILGG